MSEPWVDTGIKSVRIEGTKPFGQHLKVRGVTVEGAEGPELHVSGIQMEMGFASRRAAGEADHPYAGDDGGLIPYVWLRFRLESAHVGTPRVVWGPPVLNLLPEGEDRP